MFVTNLTNKRHGIDGVIILKPKEQNRWVPDTPDYIARVDTLKRNKIVAVSMEEGLVKPSPVEPPTDTNNVGDGKAANKDDLVGKAGEDDADSTEPTGENELSEDTPKKPANPKGSVNNGRNTRSSKNSK